MENTEKMTKYSKNIIKKIKTSKLVFGIFPKNEKINPLEIMQKIQEN